MAGDPGTAKVKSVELFREVTETSAASGVDRRVLFDQGLAGVGDDIDRHRPGHADVASASTRSRVGAELVHWCTARHSRVDGQAVGVDRRGADRGLGRGASPKFKATAAPIPTLAVPASVPQAFAVSPMTGFAG